MSFVAWLKVLNLILAFVVGAILVHKFSQRKSRRKGGARSPAMPGPAGLAGALPRPPQQVPLRGYDGVVEATLSAELVASVERRTRFSSGNFVRDCAPVLEAFAEFVQMLPASESHHHAQPGGLWLHALEVLDAALTFRAGMEIPPSATTEDRKKQEHRWTYAVFVAALLHDVGKPVTDVKVQLFGEDPRAGRPWAPMAGSMKTFGAHWYSISFAEPGERDYKAHQKLAAMLLHSFVPQRSLRWLAEEGEALPQLLAYLSGEDPDGLLGSIVKRADSDSVRRNLLHGPRTRFASARTRPLIERLMEALRRMLQDGGVLPLNRAGAAGWVYDDKLWFVCKRLADEVRSYLAKNESGQALPGTERNDRLFDTWQEYGAALPAPDGGAVWSVRVECDGWSPPDALTVLCFPLDKLYTDPAAYPKPMNGRVVATGGALPAAGVAPGAGTPTGTGGGAPNKSRPAAASSTPAAALPSATHRPATVAGPVPAREPAAGEPLGSTSAAGAGAAVIAAAVVPQPAEAAAGGDGRELPAPATGPLAQESVAVPLPAHAALPRPVPVDESAPPAASELHQQTAESVPAAAGGDDDAQEEDDGVLAAEDAASREFAPPAATRTPELGLPLRPLERGQRPPTGGSIKSSKGPSPVATAFMAWVAAGVGSGALKYNEEAAPVHFVREGALLLSPELFRRFLAEHESVPDGPIAALRESHGEKAFARLQNELAKSGWTVRNGDENVHHYAFIKADKQLSRAASFFLIGRPELFWNPVPAPNERIRLAPRTKKLAVPPATSSGTSTGASKTTSRSTA